MDACTERQVKVPGRIRSVSVAGLCDLRPGLAMEEELASLLEPPHLLKPVLESLGSQSRTSQRYE